MSDHAVDLDLVVLARVVSENDADGLLSLLSLQGDGISSEKHDSKMNKADYLT